MISSHLAGIMAPFAMLANKHALTDVYKCVEIQPNCIRGCSAYGIVEADIAIGIPETVWLDAIMFVSVLKTMPSSEEVVFELKGGSLHWECGLAVGKLAIMSPQKVASWPEDGLNAEWWSPPAELLDALDLGVLSCGAAGMATAGSFGVVFDNRGDLSLISSDDVTIARCLVGPTTASLPERLTLSPDAAAMLACVLDGDIKDVKIRASGRAVYCVNKAFRCLLRPIPPVKHDLRALTDNYASADTAAELPREQIAAFIKRAGALADSKQRTYVVLQATEGAVSMSFSSDVASAEDFYLVEGLDIPTLAPIKLDAARMARALAHVSDLVLDHVDRRVLVLRGKSPEFQYMISGRPE